MSVYWGQPHCSKPYPRPGHLQATRGMRRPCDRGTKDSRDLFQKSILWDATGRKSERVRLLHDLLVSIYK